MARTAAVRTPGVALEESGAEGMDDMAESPALVTLTPQQLDAMVQSAVAKFAAAQRQAAKNPANPDEDLPDAAQIDPAKILRPTLSKQGYVVPKDYGKPVGDTFAGG